MQVDIHSSFVRDSKKLTPAIKESIAEAIMLMEKAVKFSEIPGIKALQGGKKAKNAYRMRVADHRLCFYFKDEVISLIRVLPRKEVYKVFP